MSNNEQYNDPQKIVESSNNYIYNHIPLFSLQKQADVDSIITISIKCLIVKFYRMNVNVNCTTLVAASLFLGLFVAK